MTVTVPGGMLREVNEKLLVASIEQQELAEAAQQAKERLAALINSVDAAIVEVDAATGNIMFLSDKIPPLLGYPTDVWYRRGFWRRVVHPEDRRATLAFFAGTIHTYGVHVNEFRVVAANGHVLWVLNHAVVATDENGAATLLRCVMMDISVQKRAEALQAEALLREQRITDYLQRPLRNTFAENALPHLRVAGCYEPAFTEAEVGGDFYDIFTAPDAPEDHRTLLCVGDVMGKGLPAAALAVQLKELVRAYGFENLDPADILARLNNFQCHAQAQESDPDAPLLAGVVIGVIDYETGTLTVASAGMEPVTVIRADGFVRTLAGTGITIGIQPGEIYQSAVVHFSAGDTVLLTTDGLTEARQGRKFLGYDGLMTIANTHKDRTVTEMCDAIVGDARTFAGRFSDDICLVVVRRV